MKGLNILLVGAALLTMLIILGVAAVAGVAVAGATNPHPSASDSDPQVTICHRTDSVTNPYVRTTVDDDAVDGGGHNDHTRHTGPVATSQAVAQALKDAHLNWGDIIPPHPGDSLNWDADGQAMYNNDCNFVPVPTPTPPPTCEETETCATPTSTPTVQPSPTPTGTPKPTATTTPTITPVATSVVRGPTFPSTFPDTGGYPDGPVDGIPAGILGLAGGLIFAGAYIFMRTRKGG